MTNTMNIDFKFRTKFEKLIRNDEHRQALIFAFNNFCSYTPLEAINYLWKLTYYSGDIHFNELDETAISILLLDLYLDFSVVSPSEILNLRNELRYQYELLNPNFLKVEMDEQSEKAFTELANKSDIITATIVYEHCISFQCITDEDMSRILFLLNNSNENNFFGGIRSLYFTKREAIYLKPFHTQIHDLLEAVYEFYTDSNSSKNDSYQEPNMAIENTEFEDDSDLPFVWGNEHLSVDSSADNCSSTFKFKELTSKNILEHKHVFALLESDLNIDILKQISDLGFDLNEVIVKQQKIINLLIADKDLSN